MRNIKIESTDNNTFVVKADTERFGTQKIMFEGTDNECVSYIHNNEQSGFALYIQGGETVCVQV